MNFQCETTTHCNFTCSYCPNRDMQRKREFMSDDVWSAILNLYIVPYRDVNRFCTPTVIFHKDGESLLDKKLPQRLQQMAEVAPDIKIDIYSNGVLLPTWTKRGQDFIKFLATLPNKVRYLMSYHPRNHDNSVNDYTATIDYMQQVLMNPPRNVEFITVSHKSKHVTQEMQDEWRRNWDGYPITCHSNATLNPWTGRNEDEGLAQFGGCPYGDFGHMFFGVTGNVIACCLDLEEEIVFGNVLTDTPTDMVAKLDKFYTDQRNKKVDHAVCHNCHGIPQTPGRLVSLGLLT